MRRVIICASVFMLVLPGNLLREARGSAWEQGLRIEMTERGYPLLPSESEVRCEVPGSLFFAQGPLSRAEIAVWYLSASPYLIPNSFFEVGISMGYALVDGKSFKIETGIGTAFSMHQAAISAPLIVSLEGRFFELSWLEVRSQFQTLVYAEGIIEVGAFTTYVKPFGSGLIIGLGPSGAVSFNWTNLSFHMSYGLLASLGFQF